MQNTRLSAKFKMPNTRLSAKFKSNDSQIYQFLGSFGYHSTALLSANLILFVDFGLKG